MLDTIDKHPGLPFKILRCSHMVIWKTLHEKQLYPYIQRVQTLTDVGFKQRIRFLSMVLTTMRLSTYYFMCLFKNEAMFSRDSITNYPNYI